MSKNLSLQDLLRHDHYEDQFDENSNKGMQIPFRSNLHKDKQINWKCDDHLDRKSNSFNNLIAFNQSQDGFQKVTNAESRSYK